MKTIIFDLDGTLLNTITDIAISMNYALEKHNLPHNSINDYISYVGDGIVELVKRSIHNDSVSEKEFNEILNEYSKYYDCFLDVTTRPFPNIYKLIRKLKKMDYELAVISNKPDSPSKYLINKFFPDTFIYVAGSKENVLRKPEVESLDIYSIESGFNKCDMIYVGDSRIDAKFAENYGIPYFLFEHGYEKKETLHSFKPIAFLNDPLDMLKYLK